VTGADTTCASCWRSRNLRRLLGSVRRRPEGRRAVPDALILVVFFDPERRDVSRAGATAFAVLLLPFSIVGALRGVFLDRWRRQRVLRNANLVRAGLVV
jgi:hypothetical protein